MQHMLHQLKASQFYTNFLKLISLVIQSSISEVQSKLFITSFVITEYSISDIKLLGTDLFPLNFPFYNRIFT